MSVANTMGTEGKVRIQSVGWVPGKPAGDLVPGDVLIWNFGGTTKVLGMVKETPKQITWELESEDGTTHLRKFGKSRLVGMAR